MASHIPISAYRGSVSITRGYFLNVPKERDISSTRRLKIFFLLIVVGEMVVLR